MTDLILQFGLPALFLLMISNGLISAPPSEVILAAAGALAIQAGQSIFVVILCGSAGNLIGTCILYIVGRKFGLERTIAFVERVIIRIGLNANRAGEIYSWSRFLKDSLAGNALLWIAVLRCLPVVRSIVSLPCGALGINFSRFVYYSSAGIHVWNAVWVCVGAFAYDAYRRSEIMVLFILLLIAIIILWFLKRWLQKHYRQWKLSDSFTTTYTNRLNR